MSNIQSAPVVETSRKYHAFLCHRNEGGKDQARLLKSELDKNERRVFIDVERPRPGDWEDHIYEALDQTDVLLAVLTFECLNGCFSENDMVRKELEYARGKGIPVIPVIWEGFSWPNMEDQPEIIRWLKRQQGRKHSHEYFTYFIEKLLEWVPSD